MVSASSYIPPFYFYQFAQAISAPYSSLNAYKSDIIDENGNVLKPESSIDPFEYLVIKLKKIFDMLPGNLTKAQLKNYFTALQYFTEEAKYYNLPEKELLFFIEGYITSISNGNASYFELNEDMSAGGMAVPASKPESTGGVVGYDPILSMGLQRRKKPKYFDNCELFDVCPEEFLQFKAAKSWNDVPDSENKTYLQRFQRRNKNAKIGIKSINPISGDHDLHWITYPAKNFMEEFKLGGLDILNEKTKAGIIEPGDPEWGDKIIAPIHATPENIKNVLSKLREKHKNHIAEMEKNPKKRDRGYLDEYHGRIIHALDGLHNLYQESMNKNSKVKNLQNEFNFFLGHLDSIHDKDASNPHKPDAYSWNNKKGIHTVDIKKINTTTRVPVAKTDTESHKLLQKAHQDVLGLQDAPKKRKKVEDALKGISRDIPRVLASLYMKKYQGPFQISQQEVRGKSKKLLGKFLTSQAVETWAGDTSVTPSPELKLRSRSNKRGFELGLRKTEFGSSEQTENLLTLLSNTGQEEPKSFNLSSDHMESLSALLGDDHEYFDNLALDPHITSFIK